VTTFPIFSLLLLHSSSSFHLTRFIFFSQRELCKRKLKEDRKEGECYDKEIENVGVTNDHGRVDDGGRKRVDGGHGDGGDAERGSLGHAWEYQSCDLDFSAGKFSVSISVLFLFSSCWG